MSDLERAKEIATAALTKALVQLAEHGLPADVAEVLVQGNPRLGCPPGALAKVLATARTDALREAAEMLRETGKVYAGHGSSPDFVFGTLQAADIVLSLLKEPTQ